MPIPYTNRRGLLAGAATATVFTLISRNAEAAEATAIAPLPLTQVRLLPSPYKTAVDVNERYLLTLDPDRFLHNFRSGAGLKPKAEAYGGWEQDTIAGHSLGHYLSAIALMYAQTDNPVLKDRAAYVIDELALIQGMQGDGYVAGFLRRRKDGTVVDGKEIFPEIMAGDISSAGFDLNGCWVPLYNWHKLYSGLFDVQTWCGHDKAIAVGVALGGYIDKVFAALNDDQVQQVLDCEHGGINDSFAELYSRTHDARWLRLSERLYHKKVLDPLTARQDILANHHSNTNIPKILGLARLYEVSGKEDYRTASSFFWQRVTGHHSFVIGGNGDREYFFEPDTISKHITEATCEHCATYNMMKLTRQLYAWAPDASYFDYYERAHLNHVMAQQNPKTGMFSYMTPLFTGAAREFSDPVDNWTCCHGTGMESHAKHADSIFWTAGDKLFVNLYIPATANWTDKGAKVRLDTGYPYDGDVKLSVTGLRRPTRLTVALRVPGWAKTATVTVNGKSVVTTSGQGYLMIDRVWQVGDVVALSLPLDLRMEATSDNPGLVAVLRGPMVMAADLGPSDKPWAGADPALVGSDILGGFKPVAAEKAVYRTEGVGRPGALDIVPFYGQYERRSAVYFNRFSDADWQVQEAAFTAEQARQRDLAARSVDVMYLGEMQAERDHDLQSDVSWPGTYRGRNGRDARQGGYMSFIMKVSRDSKPAGPLELQATYWGDDRCGFDILIDGQKLTSVVHEKAPHPGQFFDETYPVPESFTTGKSQVLIKLQPQENRSTGMIFGLRLFTAGPASLNASPTI